MVIISYFEVFLPTPIIKVFWMVIISYSEVFPPAPVYQGDVDGDQ